ncbi:MFS transporter [Chloroflexota bacterium]
MNQELNQPVKTKPRFFYGYIVVVAAFIIHVVMFGPRSCFGVFFKPLVAEFGLSRALLSGVYSTSTIVQGVSGIVMGHLNDRLGPRVVLTLCGFLVGLGYLLMSTTTTAWQLYLFYSVILGIGMGGLYAPIMSTVAKWFVTRRSVMTGIVIAGDGIGGMLSPPIINWLIFTYGWRYATVIIGALVLMIVIITAQFLRRDPAKMGQLPYGKIQGEKQELNILTEGLSLKEATHTRQFWTMFVIIFCFGFCAISTVVHIVPHATDLGISAATAANILATIGISVVISSIVLGSTADRIGNRRTFVFCFILISAALFWLLTAREVWTFYLFAVVLGIGGGGGSALTSPLAAELFGMKSHGLIVGISVFCQTIGGAFGSFMAGYIFDVNGSYQSIFIAFAASGVIALILAATLRPVNKLNL